MMGNLPSARTTPYFRTFSFCSMDYFGPYHVKIDQFGSRQVLVIFVITGFVLCGVVEQSASVALRANSTSSYSAAEFAEYVENTSYITSYCQPPSNHDYNSTNSTVHVVRSIPHIEIPMTRTDKTEAVLRQAFMWGTLVSPLAASRIAARVGAERLFGAGVFGAGIVAVLVPAAWLTACHVIIRFIQGIFMGATWPAAHMLAVTWIKPKHVSGFVSLYTAVNLGYAIVGILGTVLVRKLGRDWLSYIIALSSFFWYFLWWRFVEESLHPNHPKRDEHRHLPWRRLLMSKPAWACGIAVIGSQWADATLMLGVTKYLKLVYGFSLEYKSPMEDRNCDRMDTESNSHSLNSNFEWPIGFGNANVISKDNDVNEPPKEDVPPENPFHSHCKIEAF
ncbi:hypothetical protein JTB14_033024 [Gonioctena quinquepunctata]|nr:hypothetical protein JTB14_033024 [Gonioctena quinquepunctata]